MKVDLLSKKTMLGADLSSKLREENLWGSTGSNPWPATPADASALACASSAEALRTCCRIKMLGQPLLCQYESVYMGTHARSSDAGLRVGGSKVLASMQ